MKVLITGFIAKNLRVTLNKMPQIEVLKMILLRNWIV